MENIIIPKIFLFDILIFEIVPLHTFSFMGDMKEIQRNKCISDVLFFENMLFLDFPPLHILLQYT